MGTELRYGLPSSESGNMLLARSYGPIIGPQLLSTEAQNIPEALQKEFRRRFRAHFPESRLWERQAASLVCRAFPASSTHLQRGMQQSTS